MQQVAERIVSNTAGKERAPIARCGHHCGRASGRIAAKAPPRLKRGRAPRSSASTQDSVEAVAAHVDGAPAPRGPLRHPATVAVAVAIVVPWPESGAEGAESGADEERSDEATMAEKGGPCERPPDERPANERPADEAGPTDEAGTPHEGGPAGEARPADEAAAESADARSAETAAAKSTHATAGEAAAAESAAAEAAATESAAAAKAACARVSRIGRHHGGDETNGGERDRHLAQHVDFLLSPPQQRRDCKSPVR